MSRIIIVSLAGALLFIPPAIADLPAPSGPPDIVLSCAFYRMNGKNEQGEFSAGGADLVPDSKDFQTVMIWSKLGLMSWPHRGNDGRYSAEIQPGTLLYKSPDGRRFGHIDRYSGKYEEVLTSATSKAETYIYGLCKVSKAPRKF